MRTAAEYINDYDKWATEGVPFAISTMDAIKAINQARKEAIEECAAAAKDILLAAEGTDFGVEKELKELIDQLK